MIIPNNKKFLVYIKTAKTGGSSFLEILKQISKIKNINYYTYNELEININNIKQGDIIMIVNDQINFFIKEFPNIYKDSFFVLISRNPIDRLISGWQYHPMTKNKSLDVLINNPLYPPKKPCEIKWKQEMPRDTWDLFSMYNHFYCGQTETLMINNKFIIDYLIKFENYNEEIKKFLLHLNLTNDDINKVVIPHLKKNNNLYYKNIINLIPNDLKMKIYEIFINDYKLLNYNSPTSLAVPS